MESFTPCLAYDLADIKYTPESKCLYYTCERREKMGSRGSRMELERIPNGAITNRLASVHTPPILKNCNGNVRKQTSQDLLGVNYMMTCPRLLAVMIKYGHQISILFGGKPFPCTSQLPMYLRLKGKNIQ